MNIQAHLQHESSFRGPEVFAKRDRIFVLIAGVGALGSFLVDLLARQGFHSMRALDRERVDPKNFGNQSYGNADIGKQKAAQMSFNIFRRLKVVVVAINEELKESNAKKHVRKADLVVDCFDNAESRNLLAKTCRDLDIPLLHSGMSVDGFGEARWDTDTYLSKPPPAARDEAGEPCEYPLASNLVQATVMITAEAVCRFVDSCERMDFAFTLQDLSITRTK